MDNIICKFRQSGSGLQVRCASLGLYRDMSLSVTINDQSETTSPSAYGIVFRQSDDGSSFYLMVINDSGQISLQKFLRDDADCQPCVVGVEPIPSYAKDDIHILQIDARGSEISAYVDGELRLMVEDDSITEAGIIRLGAFLGGTHVIFDDLRIYPYTAVPSAVTGELSVDDAPVWLAVDQVQAAIRQDAGTPISMTPIELPVSIQNFVMQGTLGF